MEQTGRRFYQFDGAKEGDGAFTNAVMYLGIANVVA